MALRLARAAALLIGLALVVTGIALFDYRLGLIVAGVGIAGLFGVEVGGET